MEWETQVFYIIMLTVFSKYEKLTAYNLWGYVIHGDLEIGQESFVMKMKLGMTIKVLKINLIISLRVMVIGGWDLMISVPILVKYIFAKSFQQPGHNILLVVSGVATLLVDHTHLRIIPRKLKNQKSQMLNQRLWRLTPITSGLTILNSVYLLKRRLLLY